MVKINLEHYMAKLSLWKKLVEIVKAMVKTTMVGIIAIK
jgi:hypothetical protein